MVHPLEVEHESSAGVGYAETEDAAKEPLPPISIFEYSATTYDGSNFLALCYVSFGKGIQTNSPMICQICGPTMPIRRSKRTHNAQGVFATPEETPKRTHGGYIPYHEENVNVYPHKHQRG